MTEPIRRAKGWVRAALTTVTLLAGVLLILGERVTGPHRWWGALVGLLVAAGLTEIVVGFRALSEGWEWRAAGAATAGGVMLVAGLLLTDSWRWVAAGAWPVAVAAFFLLVWPEPDHD